MLLPKIKVNGEDWVIDAMLQEVSPFCQSEVYIAMDEFAEQVMDGEVVMDPEGILIFNQLTRGTRIVFAHG